MNKGCDCYDSDNDKKYRYFVIVPYILYFLCSQEAAYDNFEYIYYGTPNIAAQELIDEDIINNPGVFPDEETIEKCEVYNYLGEEAEDMYYELWKKVK